MLHKLWRRLFPHIHRWYESGYNVYGCCIEERCAGCGAYRHHGFDDLVGGPLGKVGKWHNGRAPRAKDTK